MPLPSRLVSIPRLREAVAARAAASSRRAVSRETGIGPRSIELFLAGSTPQPKSLDKLLRWYRTQIEDAEGPPVSATEAVLALVRAFSGDARDHAAASVAAHVLRLHEEAGLAPPADLPIPPSETSPRP
jgi:hypothetical protein